MKFSFITRKPFCQYNILHTMVSVYITYTTISISRFNPYQFTKKTSNQFSCSFTNHIHNILGVLCGYRAALDQRKAFTRRLVRHNPKSIGVLVQDSAILQTKTLQQSHASKRLNKEE